jgi:uncharacterized protein
MSIIRPHAAGAPYAVLLRFDSHANLTNRIESPTGLGFVERANPG